MATVSAQARQAKSLDSLVATLLAAGVASLRAHARAMRDAATQDDPEIVHQARVAVRRMRAALRVFPLEESAGRLRVARAQNALKALGRVLGEARDWDVIAGDLLPARRALLDRELGRPAASRVARQARKAQLRAHAAARRFVAGPRFDAILAPIERLGLALESADGNEKKDAVLHALRRQRARVLRKSAHLARLDAAARHKLRIEGKRLRYATELCAPLLGHGAKGFLRALKRIQDALGRTTDARMLAERIGILDARAGLVLEADERACVERGIPEIQKLFKRWTKAKAPG